VGYAAALTKAVMHGIVRGVINVIQNGGKFFSAFASAFVSSAFSVGRYTFGRAAVFARTAVMATVGGFASVISGGKFLNGAVSAAFVHLFNAERGNFVKRARKRALQLSVNKIIAAFKKMRNLPLAQRLMLLYKFTKNHSILDFKQEGKIYEDYGNFVYGAVGSALDIPAAVLLRGAGWASVVADPRRAETFGHWYDIGGSYGDDPKDQTYIQYGIDYYRNQYDR